jgi:ribose 5-phosphate isomerase A
MSQQDQYKEAASEAAAKIVEDGMIVGLGSGTTATFFLRALAKRIARDNLHLTGIASSYQTAALARELKIPLATFAEHTQIDLTIDGADEVVPNRLDLLKGHGGALLREKIVAASSKKMVVIVDESKIVDRLGSHFPVPVEVVPFGWETTKRRLEDIGGNPSLRPGKDNSPFLTDGGHYIMDCAFGPMEKPKEIAHHLDHIVGAVEHGLFLGFASEVFVAGSGGLKILRKNAV